MTILAIDTALNACSLALLDESGANIVMSEPMNTGHAEAFFGLMDRLFERAGINPQAITAVGTTIGPGSFTGIRVGLSAARTLGLAWGVPVHGVTTLDAFAESIEADCPFAVLIDARRGAYYCAVYNTADDPVPALVPADDPLADLPEKIAISGPALPAELTVGRDVIACPPYVPADAIATMVSRGERLHAPSPLYLRDADAKPQTKNLLVRA